MQTMFNRLQQKWKMNGRQVLVILITFALGGSLTGFVGKRLMSFLEIEIAVLYILIYILLVTLIWPFAVLIISIPLGQFPFFRKYILKIGNRLFTRRKN